MARAAREARSAPGRSGPRRCMGTLVLDDLVDDPRVGGTREAPGDSNRGRDEARQPPPAATDPRDRERADGEDDRRRSR